MSDLIERASAIKALQYVLDSPNYSKALGEILRIPTADTPQTERKCENCGQDKSLCKYCIKEDRMWIPFKGLAVDDDGTLPQADEIGDCNICRFAGCSECDDCINGSEWVRMVDYLEDIDDERTERSE